MLTYIPIPPFEFARGGARQGWAMELGSHGTGTVPDQKS